MGPPDLDGEVELGFALLPECRGRGLGALAVAALTQWALRHGAKRVIAHVPADQQSGRRALQGNGFLEEQSAPYPGVARYVRA
jgi:GNAT superfamily N-acetyltransferase